MKKKNYKKRVSKRKVNKCIGICCTYCDLQYRYADMLSADDRVESFEVNVPILDEEYTTDFLIKYTNGKIKAFECVEREHMLRPSTSELLNKSKSEWYARVTEGLAVRKASGKQVGRAKGSTYVTKKSVEIKKVIQEKSRDFSGTYTDRDILKLLKGSDLSCTEKSYYKYKKELREELLNG